MQTDREVAYIRSGTRLLTKTEAEAAIEHADAFVRLAACVDAEHFGMAAQEWLDKYSDGGHHERN